MSQLPDDLADAPPGLAEILKRLDIQPPADIASAIPEPVPLRLFLEGLKKPLVEIFRLLYLKAGDDGLTTMSVEMIAACLSTEPRYVQHHLRQLKNLGLLCQVGKAQWRVFLPQIHPDQAMDDSCVGAGASPRPRVGE